MGKGPSSSPSEKGKRKGRKPDVNVVSGDNGALIHILDSCNRKWLVDGGALISLVPPTHSHIVKGPQGPPLSAANGSSINCFGSVRDTLIIEGRSYEFNFTVADVKQRILGADFLAAFSLAPNHRDSNVLSLDTLEVVAHSIERPNILSVSTSSFTSPFDDLLKEYPEITTPAFTLKEVSHGVEHHIHTGDTRPIQSRARKLSLEELAVAKAEIDKLV